MQQHEHVGATAPIPHAPAGATTPQRQHVLGRMIYSQTQPARWLRCSTAALAIAVGLLHLRVPVGALAGDALYRRDILQGYLLARAVVDRIDPYLPVPELAARYLGGAAGANLPHPTPHPPTLGLLCLPLAVLDYPAVAIVWLGLELACFVASVCLLGRALDTRLSPRMTLGIAAVLLIWYPFWEELAWGQLQIPMLMLLAGAWVALRSRRSVLGGALVGLAILLKPVPWPLLLLFVLRKDRPALTGAFSVVLVGYSMAGCVVGLDALWTYFTVVLPAITASYRAAWANISISSLAWRLFDGTGAGTTSGSVAPPVVKSMAAAQLGAVGLPFLLLLVACLAVRKQRSLDVAFGVMVSVSILTSPICWPVYLVLLSIPAAQVIRWLACHRLPSEETNVALVVTMLLIIDWQVLARFLARLAQSVRGINTLPFALAQLPLMTAVAVGALAWLAVWLGARDCPA